MVRILHTADWHLGKNIAEESREADFRFFIDWLVQFIKKERIDVVLISGDVFDASMPPTWAQDLYYEFLSKVEKTNAAGVVVTPGNHDSTAFLRASRHLLNEKIFVASSDPVDQIVVVERGGTPILGVAAVPYLREAEVRGEMNYRPEVERARAWMDGVAARYESIYQQLDSRLPKNVPLAAMGHQFVTGAGTGAGSEEDPEASAVYVGSLRNVGAHVFGSKWDYGALGHIHKPSEVKGSAFPLVYPGTPLKLSFNHSERIPQIVVAEIEERGEGVKVVRVPVPQNREVRQIEVVLEDVVEKMRAAAEKMRGLYLFLVVNERSRERYDAVREAAAEAAEEIDAKYCGCLPKYFFQDSQPGLAYDGVDAVDLKPEDVFNEMMEAASSEYESREAFLKRREELAALFREVVEEVEKGEAE